MARNADIKTCRYSACTHPNRKINLTTDDYVVIGKSYYHRICLEEKEVKIAEEKEAKERFKPCCYKKCRHKSVIIDKKCEDYMQEGSKHYHSDCWRDLKTEEEKEKAIKADIQTLKDMWIANISSTVPLAHLYRELNAMIREQGIDSKYVVFTLEYCIKNKMNLRYPGGLKYYVDRQDIKDAYAKVEARKKIGNAKFTVDDSIDEFDTPKFSVNKRPSGFGSILNRWN